ncbi:hypothetical protein [Sinorhizobium sp. RAC02]|uniref:hypothetical protein n=1 Tax=Sinorhizobium sp. RAC02 TaxID=1842534 RepID=UPI00083D594D|nr:hypothetical protein [Sinorhizobium sp. RAC02]AOF94315.1 hypothetical protein BSY16_5772 [Sinorhizobium sp. RAC02]
MSDCDNLHPVFWDVAKSDTIACRPRRRPRPSLVEALAVVVVLLFVLVTNFDRWTSDAKAEAPATVGALADPGSGYDAAHCRQASSLGDC